MWLVDLNYNFNVIGHNFEWLIDWLKLKVWCELWLIELSDNKLSNNNLASELMKKGVFLNQLQSRTL